MEFNEISMLMDVKLDIYDKRPESLKFKIWTKCQVKIEAIKCLPCFLRLNFQSVPQGDSEQSAQLSVSINVPGVTISLATSRFKQHSYGLFWTHNRRDCFIYFALDTEMSCRKHMKWIKKSIKNLELYRQISLEQKRSSRGTGLFCQTNKLPGNREFSGAKNAIYALGPLPQIPDDHNSFGWSGRVSRASEIYEEILEDSALASRLSRRLSRTSIASGIYEEMKPCSVNKNAIAEEEHNCPPPLPPLPSHRKRIYTSESTPFGTLGDIPRCNTNPETDLAKSKSNKNINENSLVSGRSKRAESVSATTAYTLEDILSDRIKYEQLQSIGASDTIIKKPPPYAKANRRTSFSSPDLSKINFLDTFDEEKLADLLHLNISSDLDDRIGDDFDCDDEVVVYNHSTLSLNESCLAPSRSQALKSRPGSMETLNVSTKLPQNFNFSACNTSSINLLGASSAASSLTESKRNNLVVDDELSGYCVMAPIASKQQSSQSTITTTTSSTTSSTTSGYSTGSYTSPTSSSSSNTQVTDNKEQLPDNFPSKKNAINAPLESFYDKLPLRKAPLPVADWEKKIVYENCQTCSPLSGSGASAGCKETTTPIANKHFVGNLYENLLTVKAALELEQPQPSHICPNTPTDTTAEHLSPIASHQDGEIIYKTPRKSIISVDDKIPSYYPNSSETIRVRQRTNSSNLQATPALLKTTEKGKSCLGFKSLVGIKLKNERKENFYMSPPQKIIEKRQKSSKHSSSPVTNASQTKKSANAQKISENVYTVNLGNKTNNSNKKKSPYKEVNEPNQHQEKLQNELLQLALLQKIDFKFDDSSSISHGTSTSSSTSIEPAESGIAKLEQAELEYENCYQASRDATRLLHKYATSVPNQSLRISQPLQQNLQPNESSKQETLMSQSAKLESPSRGDDAIGSPGATGSKKFGSLPRFKKIDFSPLKLKINNVLQRSQNQDP